MSASEPPVLRVVRGTATAEELAAVVAVLASQGAPPVEEEAPTEASRWGWKADLLRPPMLTPTPGAWRASALPR